MGVCDDGGVFPRSAKVPGQRKSRSAYAQFKARQEVCPWWAEYQGLIEEGWTWRKAAYIAWAASPTVGRWPATQVALAQEVLGLKSDRTIRTWKQRHPELEARIAKLRVEPLTRHIRDVVEALITSASNPDHKAHADRKLFLEITEVYQPKGTVKFEGDLDVTSGGEPLPDYSELSDDELRALLSSGPRAGASKPDPGP